MGRSERTVPGPGQQRLGPRGTAPQRPRRHGQGEGEEGQGGGLNRGQSSGGVRRSSYWPAGANTGPELAEGAPQDARPGDGLADHSSDQAWWGLRYQLGERGTGRVG